MILVPTMYCVRLLYPVGTTVAGAWLDGLSVTNGLEATVCEDAGITKGILEGVSVAVIIFDVPFVVVDDTLVASLTVGPSDVGIAESELETPVLVVTETPEVVSSVPVGNRVTELVAPVPVGTVTPELVGPVPVGADIPELVIEIPVETDSEVEMPVPDDSDVGIPLAVGAVGNSVGAVVTPVPDGIPDIPVGGRIPEVVPGTSVGTAVTKDDSRLDRRLVIGMGMAAVPVGKTPLETSDASSEPTLEAMLDTMLGMSGMPVGS
jgi:hypothetical protein